MSVARCGRPTEVTHRVLFLTQWFDPEPAMKGLAFVQALTERGLDVEVATGFPNYPSGRIAPGYRLRAWQREVMQGVVVRRLWLWPSHDASSLGRVANYLSFFVSAFLFCLLRGRRYAAIYVYRPPITVGLAAALAGLVTRRPILLDVQDLWPDSVAASGMSGTGRMARVLGPICRFVYRRAARVIGQSKGMTARLIQRGVPAARAATLINWADEAMARPRGVFPVETLGFEGRFSLVYGGNLGRVQGLETLVHAAERAGRDVPELQLTLIGTGVERDRLSALIEEIGARHVQLRPGVPQDQIGDIFAAADGLVLHLIDDPLFEITIPSKTQFYMAMGRPILIGVRGEAADMVTDAGAGLAVPPGDVEAMARAMIALARMPADTRAGMGARARRAYDDHYGFDRATAATADLIGQVLGEGHPRPVRAMPLKRAVDVAVSAVALVLLSPLLLATALAVRLRLGAPVLFRQVRPGLHGRPFEMVKFRTMRDALGPDGSPRPDAERLTPFGRWLRSTSLDELPELWNVLKGDMSLVGPRPLLMEYLPLYSAQQARRHEVRPGITGWAQVNGRNAIGWDEKFALDVWYVDHRSLRMDIAILGKTATKALRREGINADGAATMTRFTGPVPPVSGDA
jgi:lipopolysaccharide/colanic/teichoic acid biosynthesis glycosyltransferase/glycosyltransferase involved in cell wall biosynthesis